MLKPNDEFLFTRQRHEAEKMGLHYDLRLVHGDKAYSFATLKDMPKPGEIIGVFEQPVHDRAYALSEKVVIPTGQYGAGTTYLDWVRKAMVAPHSTDTTLIIFTKDGEKFLLKKAPTKENEKSWIFRNITGMGKSQNPYLQKIEQGMDKQASLIGGAVATHLLQNIGTQAALKSKRVSKYLADSFSQGVHGVVDTSKKAKLTRAVLGAGLPDVAVAHKKMHDLGSSIREAVPNMSKRHQAALRMISEGRFNDLKKYNMHNDPIVRKVHEHVRSASDMKIPSLDELVGKAHEVKKLFNDKSHPLLSNIAKNISKGEKPVGPQFKPGRLTAKPIIGGAVASLAADPAAGIINTSKSLLSSKVVANHPIGKKISGALQKQFITSPIKHGIQSAGNMSELKNKAYKFGVNPVSANLKRTSSALTDALKD